jgi:hypothetical protein
MDSHIKTLGWLNLIFGGMGVLGATLFLAGSSLLAVFLASVQNETNIPSGVIAIVGTFIAVFILALSLPSVILGIGLLQYRPWARMFGIVLSALHLLNVPLGTAVGVYGLWVLLQPQTEALLRPRYA